MTDTHPQTISIFTINNQQKLTPAQESCLLQLLPKSDQQRASQYYRWQDKQALLFGRALLQYYINQQSLPIDIQQDFCQEYLQKPQLASNEFQFNISHCQNWIVCAIATQQKIGIDIEDTQKSITLDDYAIVFSDHEINYLSSLPTSKQKNSFFNLWTRKEAAIKLLGLGFSADVKQLNCLRSPCQYQENNIAIKWIEINEDACCHIATHLPMTNDDIYAPIDALNITNRPFVDERPPKHKVIHLSYQQLFSGLANKLRC